MANVVEICNLALANIGKPPIQSLTDVDSAEAIACNQVYALTLKTMLEMAEWSFANKERELVVVNGVQSTEFEFVYAYPADCLSAREIVNVRSAKRIPFMIVTSADNSTKYIVTDQDEAVLRYTAHVTDPSLYNPTFITAFAVKLSVSLCPLLVSGTDPARQTQLQEYFQKVALPEALVTNAREGYREARFYNDITRARM